MRLFTAVYPSAEALDHLDLALASVGGGYLADSGGAVRWTPREQRHLTLAFLGDVTDGAVPEFLDCLETAIEGAQPLTLELAGCGVFRESVLFAGVAEAGRADLAALVNRAARAVVEAGLPLDDRVGSRPHVTLARASRRAAARRRNHSGHGPDAGALFGDWARALSVYRGPAWTAQDVVVVSSELGAGPEGGPLHQELTRFPLGQH
ncbi:MAG: RNA 2',3'-cyclic phosphodiesterase [Cellulomonadaceae bacterium]|nr:RNA 2',3'-cyclic phosphodiesterase [Cellulomonadaceae bacterium]